MRGPVVCADPYAAPVASEEPVPTVTVKVFARTFAGDADERCELEVQKPTSEVAAERLLEAVVTSRYPAVRPRSYDAGAASFVGPGMLVTASFRGDYLRAQAAPHAAPAVEQPSLFAA